MKRRMTWISAMAAVLAIRGCTGSDEPHSLLGPDGQPIPAVEWSEDQHQDWQEYKDARGLDTVGKAATDTAESYQSGYGQAKGLVFEPTSGASK